MTGATRPRPNIVDTTDDDGDENRGTQYRYRYSIGPTKSCPAQYKQKKQKLQRGIEFTDSRWFTLNRSNEKIVRSSTGNNDDIPQYYDCSQAISECAEYKPT